MHSKNLSTPSIPKYYMIWGHQYILSPKNHTRKIDKIHKNFELYQVFIYNFLDQNLPIFSLYMLLTTIINTSWSVAFDKVWSGGIRTFCTRNIMQEKLTKFPIIFELYQVLYIHFCPKIFRYMQILYCRHILKAFLPLPTRFFSNFYK